MSTAKRVDRGIDDDEFFSDVDIASPPAPAAEGTDDLEVGAIVADVLICVLSLCGRSNALAFFRKASRVLNRQGRMATYKGFIRPLLEYTPIISIGAAQSHLQALDRIQRKAMRIIGDQTLLPTLGTCCLVSAFTYLYKLHCISAPPS